MYEMIFCRQVGRFYVYVKALRFTQLGIWLGGSVEIVRLALFTISAGVSVDFKPAPGTWRG